MINRPPPQPGDQEAQPSLPRRTAFLAIPAIVAAKVTHALHGGDLRSEASDQKKDLETKRQKAVEAKIEAEETAIEEARKKKPLEVADLSELKGSNLVKSYEVVVGALNNKMVVFIDNKGDILEVVDLRNTPTIADAPTFVRNNDKLDLSKEWIDVKRHELRLQNPTIFHQRGQYPAIEGRRSAIEGEAANVTYLDTVLRSASKKVGDTDKNYLELARETLAKTTLPEDFQKLVVYGVAGTESAYDNSLIHDKTKATGVWQLIEETAGDFGLKVGTFKILKGHREVKKEVSDDTKPKGKKSKKSKKPSTKIIIEKEEIWKDEFVDERKDFTKATECIARFFTTQFKNIQENEHLKKLVADYKVDEKGLLYACVISCYHTGQNRVPQMLKWFAENYPPETLKEKLSGNLPANGQDLYVLISRLYMDNRVDKNYGQASNEYYVQVQATTNLCERRLANKDYKPDLPKKTDYIAPKAPKAPKVPELPAAAPEEIPIELTGKKIEELETITLRKRIIALVSGALAGLSLGSVGNFITGKTTLHRRQFLESGLGATAGTALGFGLAQKPTITLDPLPEAVVIPTFNEDKPFNFEAIAFSEELGHELKKLNSLIDPKKANPEVKLPRKVHGTLIEKWLLSAQPPRFFTRRAVRMAARARKLIALNETGSTSYRCRGIGQQGLGFIDPRRNDPELMYTYPHVSKLIENIEDKLNHELHSLGMPGRYRSRLIVTSSIRPDDYSVNGNSDTSSHKFGVAFDLSRTRFDIVDTEKKTFYSFPDCPVKTNEDAAFGVEEKLEVTKNCFAALSRVLLKMHNEDQIIVNDEPQANHVHIVDKTFTKSS